MDTDWKGADPWAQIIVTLRGRSYKANLSPAIRGYQHKVTTTDTQTWRRALNVRLIERLDSTTVVVSWQDATRCHYGDQTWKMSRARCHGVCAMSGQPIAPRDYVYRPSRRTAVCNSHAMILASVLESEVPI
ncbi:DUF3331 domain-containing protein [Caballeronia sp. GAFFF1]|uniref:DUF3331 domain-containing protein n=1 Tax=Caballeronia sp. GAFFF1 TaxID=2921779 RepID=UPI002027D56A|nr:DUF3331 domain-containing protein [Caballeronia sp. GAFFF1]